MVDFEKVRKRDEAFLKEMRKKDKTSPLTITLLRGEFLDLINVAYYWMCVANDRATNFTKSDADSIVHALRTANKTIEKQTFKFKEWLDSQE